LRDGLREIYHNSFLRGDDIIIVVAPGAPQQSGTAIRAHLKNRMTTAKNRSYCESDRNPNEDIDSTNRDTQNKASSSISPQLQTHILLVSPQARSMCLCSEGYPDIGPESLDPYNRPNTHTSGISSCVYSI